MSVTLDQPSVSQSNPILQSRLRARRTLKRLALALAGLAVAGLGQYLFSQQSLWDGLPCYVVGVVLFVRALGKHVPAVYPQKSNAQTCRPETLNLSTGWRRSIGAALLIWAILISFFSFSLFGDQVSLQNSWLYSLIFADVSTEPQLIAWWFYLAALGLLVAGVLLLTRGDSWRQTWQFIFPQRYVWISLLLILGLALFMRLYNLGSQPFGIWFDEAEAGLRARYMLQESTYRPVMYPPINVTGHQLAVYAVALNWLGDTIYSMRLVSVMLGVGGVLAAFLFGRQLWGPRFGLLLALLVAVSRWHINFSRIAMTGVDVIFFEFLSLYFLTRLLQRGRLRDAMWAGLVLGFGLVFYTAFRLYVGALVIFALLGALIWWRWLRATLSGGGWWAQAVRVLMIAVTAWLVIMPVVKFAFDNPDAFWYRTQQISILNKRDQPSLIRALAQSTGRHLLMFNVEGDKNGRHNLPGAPMLDPAMAILFLCGLGLAVVKPRYPANAFFVLLIPLALAGGILAVDFEAPQSLRSIAVIPAVIYLCGLAVAVLGREAERALKPLPKIWIIGPAATLVGFLIIANGYVYFVRQANNFASWNAFSSPETIVGRKMAELGPDYAYYMSPFLAAHPTLDFLAPDALNRNALSLPDALPIRRPPDRPVVLFIHPDDVWVFEQAQKMYPHAKFEIAAGQDEEDPGPAVVYIAKLQPGDIVAIQGLELNYWPADSLEFLAEGPAAGAQPLQTERALTIDTSWPAAASVDGDFVAEWRGTLYAPYYGLYNLRLVTPGSAVLEIDGYQVFQGEGQQTTGLILAQGNHLLRLRAESAPGEVAFYWQPPTQPETVVPVWALYAPPIANNGLLGSFYPNANWEGEPALQRVDPFLDTYFHFIPLQRPYTVEWTGWLDVPQSGLYGLGLSAVPEAQLFIDDTLQVATPGPNQYVENQLLLEQGLHNILIRYKDNVDRSQIHLYWQRPTGEFGPIPGQYLWPPQGREPERLQPMTAESNVVPVTLNWITTLGGPNDFGQFYQPRDVAVLPNGNLVVADTGNQWVQIVDPDGVFIQGLTGDDLPFEEPLAVDINSSDEILVLDSTLQWIYRYDAAGNFMERFGGPGAYLFHPRGMTVFADDSTAVADTGSGRITLFDPAGAVVGSIGQVGEGPGQFNEPTDVLRDRIGTYFVAEAMNNRIQHVGPGGNFLTQWAIPPAFAYNGPHIAFGPDDSIFVTESQSHSLLRYAPDGTLLDQWQTIGPANLVAPVGVYFDSLSNRLYVTDVETHQLHIFEVNEEAE